MLLHEYLDGIQSIIEGYSRASLILASDVSSDFRTEKIGIIRGTIDFIDESSLHFTEYLDLRYGIEKLTYSFHYQDGYGKLIFRYDNARHKPALDSEDHIVCDRDELRTQALKSFQNVFGADAAEVYRKPDGTNNAKNARIHIATYQTLGIENENGDANFLTTHYPGDFFTHIVIDECHRSAWGKWSQVLTRNRSAVQIGLTATPRQLVESLKRQTEESETDSLESLPLAAEREASIRPIRPIDPRAPYGATREVWADAEITANNLAYFGEPAYEYDIAQTIEDGYLAACEIQKGRVNLDDTGITKEEIIAHRELACWQDAWMVTTNKNGRCGLC